MKSKRAKEYIKTIELNKANVDYCLDHGRVSGFLLIDIENAVELAEQDAEEKIEALKARAVCAFDSLDFTEFMTAECVQDLDNVECRLRGLFIQKLNER